MIDVPENIAEDIRMNIVDSLAKHRMGRKTDYAITLGWAPTPHGMALCWTIVFMQSGPLLGQGKNMRIAVAQQPWPTAEEIDATVKEACDWLSEQYANQLNPNGGNNG